MKYRLPILFYCLFAEAAVARAVEAQSTVENAKKFVLAKNMELSQVLHLLKEKGFQETEVFRAVASADPKRSLKEFILHPEFRRKDAVFITLESDVHGSNYRVEQISWHFDWEEDSAFPYTLRGNKILYLDKIDLDILADLSPDFKNQRKSYKQSDENPFD